MERATNVTSENDRDRVLEAALARACARTHDPASPCPDPEDLAAYVDRHLAPAARSRVETHLASCPTCQAELALIVRSAPPGPAARLPALAAWWRTRWLAWAAPAAAAATLVLAVWIGSRPSPSPPAAELRQDARAAVAGEPVPAAPSATGSRRQPSGMAAEPPRSAPPDAAMTVPSETSTRSDTAEAGSSASDRGPAPRRQPAAPAPLGLETAAKAPVPAQAAADARFAPDLPAGTRPAPAGTAEKQSPAGFAAARRASPPAADTERSAEAVARPEPERLTATTGAASPALPARGAARAEGAAAREAAAPPTPTAGVAGQRAVASAPGAGPAPAPAAAAEPALAFHAGAAPTRRFASPSGRIVWEITGTGGLRRSIDGGRQWEELRRGDPRLLSGTAVSDTVAWAVGREGIVWRTTDGTTWVSVSSPAAVDLVSIVATSENEAIVATAAGQTFRTTDGGRTWRER
jgi:hypothetical protein